MEVGGQLPPRKKSSGIHRIGGRVGHRAGPDVVEEKKILTPAGIGTPVVQPVA
jgi:hypothetical protein